jgi:sulfide:quinone oxidoreductase
MSKIDILNIIKNRPQDYQISRRDVLKIFASLGLSGMLYPQSSYSSKRHKSSAKIVIIGAGIAGMATASRLLKLLKDVNILVIEPNEKSLCYKPGYTYVANDIWSNSDISYTTQSYLEDKIKLLRDKVTLFEPDKNCLYVKYGNKISYDYLVVATGVVLEYDKIGGLEDIGSIYSSGDNVKSIKLFNEFDINSIYFNYGSALAKNRINKLIQDARNGKKLKAIFTKPNGSITGNFSSEELMFLIASRLESAGEKARDNVGINYYQDNPNITSLQKYNNFIAKEFRNRDIVFNHSYDLKALELSNKIAIFNYRYNEFDTATKQTVEKIKLVKIPYDFIHVVPPMRASIEVRESTLSDNSGYIPVDKRKLHHVKYSNIFALGDVASMGDCKTVDGIKEQYKIVSENIVSSISEKEMTSNYTGYSATRLATDFGTAISMEFEQSKEANIINSLEPIEQKWIWWLYKTYLSKPITIYGIVSGKI